MTSAPQANSETPSRAPRLAEMAAPEIERAGTGYAARFPVAGVDLRIRHLKCSGGEWKCSLTVTTVPRVEGQTAGHLFHGSFNLSGLTSRRTLARDLKERYEADWIGLLEQLCVTVLRLEEEGEPAIYLRDAAQPPEGSALLGGLALARHPVIWFGDGGTAKSYLALAAAISIHEGHPVLGIEPAMRRRVAYLDWEFDAWEHKQRMTRLLGGQLIDEALPDIVYVRCKLPLAREAERVGQIFADHDIEFAIVDSIAWACDGPPEEASAATNFFGVLRALGVGTICIAHSNRAGDTERPFGSTFWHNGARATWFVKKQQDAGQNGLQVGLFNKKANSAGLEQPLGFSVTFDSDQTRVARCDVGDVPELAGQLPLKERIKLLLRGGAKTYREIAEELEVEEPSVRQTINRWENRLFYKVSAGKSSRIGLITHGRGDA